MQPALLSTHSLSLKDCSTLSTGRAAGGRSVSTPASRCCSSARSSLVVRIFHPPADRSLFASSTHPRPPRSVCAAPHPLSHAAFAPRIQCRRRPPLSCSPPPTPACEYGAVPVMALALHVQALGILSSPLHRFIRPSQSRSRGRRRIGVCIACPSRPLLFSHRTASSARHTQCPRAAPHSGYDRQSLSHKLVQDILPGHFPVYASAALAPSDGRLYRERDGRLGSRSQRRHQCLASRIQDVALTGALCVSCLAVHLALRTRSPAPWT